jgi:hypothetical protein
MIIGVTIRRRTTHTLRRGCRVQLLTDAAHVSANYDHSFKEKKTVGSFPYAFPFLVTVCIKKLNLVLHTPAFLKLHPELMSTSKGNQTALTDCSRSENAVFFL